MPLIRSKRSRSEVCAYLELAQRLRASGVEIDIPGQDKLRSRSDLEIAQCGEAMIMELDPGVAYIIDLKIANQSGRRIYPVEVKLTLPWNDNFFHWLDFQPITERPPRGRPVSYEGYHITGSRGYVIRKDESLNHVLLDSDCGLAAGRSVRGTLIARGDHPVTDKGNGEWVNGLLTIETSDGAPNSQEVQMVVNKMASPPRPYVRKTNLRGQLLPLQPAK